MMTNMTFTKGIGSPTYMAPEILNQQKYKMPADIFSFAVTMYEVFLWEEAYPKSLFKFPWKIAEFITNGSRRPYQNNMTEKQHELICQCWSQEQRERLPIKEIITKLNEL